jgi:predicted porin
MKLRQTIVLAGLSSMAAAASAQSSVTLYGTIDQYLSYLHSSSGTSVKALEDGAYLRTRWGLRGVEDLGSGLSAKFNVEAGVNADKGGAADTARLFDRQAWVGLASASLGEVRFGRQNGSAFIRGGYTDFTTRTLGSVVNAFGVPSRYDNDIAYFSPKLFGGLNFDIHYALAEQAAASGGNQQSVFQFGADYTTGPVVVGYAALRAKPAKTATASKSAFYDFAFANYDYGQGKVYLAFVRSNNSTVGSGTTAGVNNAGTLLGNVGGVVAGTDTNANRTYNIVQLSADYKVTSSLRVGGLIGRINDTATSNDASGGALGTYYDISKRTTLYGLWHTLRNKGDQVTGAGFRPSGSAGVQSNFTAASDVNGRTINGLAAGIIHRF